MSMHQFLDVSQLRSTGLRVDERRKIGRAWQRVNEEHELRHFALPQVDVGPQFQVPTSPAAHITG